MTQSKIKVTFVELQDLVEQTGIPGEWESEGAKRTFRTWEKGILNWWESTGTFNFQGKAAARSALEKEFNEAMAKYAVTSKRATSEEADDDDVEFDDDYWDEGEKNERLIWPDHRRQDDICGDSDSPLHFSSRPEDGGDLLLNLVKEALVKYGLAVNATGPSTFIVKGTGGTLHLSWHKTDQ